MRLSQLSAPSFFRKPARVPRVRRITALARAGAVSRRSNAASRLMPPALNAKLTALSGGPVLRRITRPTINLPA